MSLIAGRGCRWPPRRDSVSPCAPLSGGGRDTHDGHENSPILVFFSNLLDAGELRWTTDAGALCQRGAGAEATDMAQILTIASCGPLAAAYAAA